METTITVHYQTATSGGESSGAETATGGANAPGNAGWGGPMEGFANGGMGVFRTGGLIRVHAGENYWFSGTQNQVPAPGGNVSISATVRSDRDIERLAHRIAQVLQRH